MEKIKSNGRADTGQSGCIVPGCGQPIHCRGLCLACYRRAQVATRFEQATWDELIELGLALPAGRQGGVSRFALALEQARAKRELKKLQPTHGSRKRASAKLR